MSHFEPDPSGTPETPKRVSMFFGMTDEDRALSGELKVMTTRRATMVARRWWHPSRVPVRG